MVYFHMNFAGFLVQQSGKGDFYHRCIGGSVSVDVCDRGSIATSTNGGNCGDDCNDCEVLTIRYRTTHAGHY